VSCGLGQTILWCRQLNSVHAALPSDAFLQARAFYGFQIAIENIHSGNLALPAMISSHGACINDSGTAVVITATLCNCVSQLFDMIKQCITCYSRCPQPSCMSLRLLSSLC
jgi:hypothetical protein